MTLQNAIRYPSTNQLGGGLFIPTSYCRPEGCSLCKLLRLTRSKRALQTLGRPVTRSRHGAGPKAGAQHQTAGQQAQAPARLHATATGRVGVFPQKIRGSR